jgi:hypothetical protein
MYNLPMIAHEIIGDDLPPVVVSLAGAGEPGENLECQTSYAVFDVSPTASESCFCIRWPGARHC